MSEKLKERVYTFALRIIKLARLLPNTEEGRIIRRQIIKSGEPEFKKEKVDF